MMEEFKCQDFVIISNFSRLTDLLGSTVIIHFMITLNTHQCIKYFMYKSTYTATYFVGSDGSGVFREATSFFKLSFCVIVLLTVGYSIRSHLAKS